MFKLFNAAIGVALAFWLFSPRAFMTRIETPSVASLRAQIAAQHPRERLAAQWSDVMQTLEQGQTR
jgi:hypothetical protein